MKALSLHTYMYPSHFIFFSSFKHQIFLGHSSLFFHLGFLLSFYSSYSSILATMYQAAESSWAGNYHNNIATRRGSSSSSDPLERVVRLASGSAVVIFSVSTCCMCHAVKRLFCGMGVHPTVYELDQDPKGKEMERALSRLLGNAPAVPVVFIGGKLIGAMDRVMASHINGTLVPLLKEAGALWL